MVQQPKLPKGAIAKLAESGQFNVILANGSHAIDWTRLFVQGYREMGHPISDVTVLCKNSAFLRNFPFMHVVNGVAYHLRYLAHLGDSMIGLASRTVCHNLLAPDYTAYFRFSNQMVSNANLATHADFASGDQAEVAVGKVLVEEGSEAALDYAKKFIVNTECFKEAQRYKERGGNILYP